MELARLLESQGRAGDAIATYEQLLQVFPLAELAHVRLGALYAMVGDKARAASHLRECLRLERNPARRADIKVRLQQLERSERKLRP